jgi:hypothetical protein
MDVQPAPTYQALGRLPKDRYLPKTPFILKRGLGNIAPRGVEHIPARRLFNTPHVKSGMKLNEVLAPIDKGKSITLWKTCRMLIGIFQQRLYRQFG